MIAISRQSFSDQVKDIPTNNWIIILLILFPLISFGQKDSTNRYHFHFFSPDTSAFRKSWNFGLDNRSSFIKDAPVNIYGLAVEYNYSKNIEWGVGFFMINKERYKKKKAELNQRPVPDLNLVYATPNFVYTFLNNRWIELSIPLEAGFGVVRFSVPDLPAGARPIAGITMIVPAEAGFATLFKLNRWIGFNGSFGYRKIVWESKQKISIKNTETKSKANLDFDGIYYKYGVNIFIGNIIKDIKYVRANRKK